VENKTINSNMKIIKKPRAFKAFTLIELLVVISIIAILASLALPSIASAITRGQITQTVSNYRQLYIVTQTASMDAQAAGSTNAGFPSDIGGVDAWSNSLVKGGYLTAPTFYKLMQVKGGITNSYVYNVGSSDTPETVFITCSNLKGGTISLDSAYGGKGGAFVTLGGSAIAVIGSNSIAKSSLTNGVTWPTE
jgi:prepilin-type N-terminal cleavage/methylation domain-containing protein